jgi:AcrR family transcriptional regulator
MTSRGPFVPTGTPVAAVDEILDAALAVYAEIGIRKATLDDIAKRADVQRGTVYRRVGGKNEVVAAVMARESTRLFELIREAAQSAETYPDRVVRAFATTVTAVRENRVWNRVLELEPATILDQLTLNGTFILAAAVEATAEILRSPDGLASSEQLRARAEILVRITHSILLTPHAYVSLDTHAEVESFARTYLLAIALPPRG